MVTLGPGEAEIGCAVTPTSHPSVLSSDNEFQTVGFNHILFAVLPPQPYTGADYSEGCF